MRHRSNCGGSATSIPTSPEAQQIVLRTTTAIKVKAFSKQVQLVQTDRTPLSEGRDFGVFSPLTWRLADLGAKHAFPKASLGWGHMPLHMVKTDLDSGAL